MSGEEGLMSDYVKLPFYHLILHDVYGVLELYHH